MTVVNLSADDHGVYECVAASVVSSVITTTLLIIERKYSTTVYLNYQWNMAYCLHLDHGIINIKKTTVCKCVLVLYHYPTQLRTVHL